MYHTVVHRSAIYLEALRGAQRCTEYQDLVHYRVDDVCGFIEVKNSKPRWSLRKDEYSGYES